MSAVRRILTWGLVAAVAALGLAAGIDALRDGEEPEPVAATESESTTSGEIEPAESTLAPAEALRAAGAPPGRLVYADESCGVHALALPDLGERPVHDLVACQGLGLPFAPPGGVRTECAGGRLTLWTGPPNDPELYARERGCGAAARPDGTVTFVQDGNVRRFTRCPGDGRSAPLLCSEPVLTRGELARQLHNERFGVSDPRIKEHAWLDDQRLAVIFVFEQPWVPGRSDLLVLFDRGRLVRAPFAAYEKLGGITPSPTGSRVAAFDAENGDILVVDDTGGPVPLASYEGHAIAWSPDESWIAVATDDGIDVFRADGEGGPIRIPVAAHDLLWLDATHDADDALARAGDELRAAGVPAGTLTYADEDCQNFTLALPELVPIGSPNGYTGICRYRAVVGGLIETAGATRSPDGRGRGRVRGRAADGLAARVRRSRASARGPGSRLRRRVEAGRDDHIRPERQRAALCPLPRRRAGDAASLLGAGADAR